MARRYHIEVAVRVDPERVWRALTDLDEIGQWFGWDAETLADEIRFIFVDHSVADRERFRIESTEPGGMYLEVAAGDGGSVVRAVQPGDEGGAGPDQVEEGWIAFLHQLKRYVEDHDNDTRRTLHLTGSGPVAVISEAVSGRLPGKDWFRGPYTRVIATRDFGPGLGALNTAAPLESNEEGNANLTLSTWGLSESEFFEVTTDWFGWWQGLTDGAEAVVARN